MLVFLILPSNVFVLKPKIELIDVELELFDVVLPTETH
uniref:Uncharacterized protein n=1 Tax=Parascaris equorum TaxID=6256 RepID=A0A914S393_PAREQ